MKAAVVFEKGGIPKYADFPEPEVRQDESLIYVKAASIKNFDRARAAGSHYSAEKEEQKPKVIGTDGVGVLENGTKVYFFSKNGAVAEKTSAEKDFIVPIPEALALPVAAALPNAVMGSAMGLRFKAMLKPGETVLINGATGVTGKVAVQIAKLYGAKKVIATGRNEESLQSLYALGADEVVSLKLEDGDFKQKIKEIHRKTPVDVILDYIWGPSVEMILSALKGDGAFSHRTRLVSVGGMGGDTIQLSSQILRGTDMQISGSGLGSWTREEFKLLLTEIIPEMFQEAAEGRLKIETETVYLKDIETAWKNEINTGKRLVVLIE
ncbi:quinone oxidoreductase family protein [Chryseobacterium gossypii]|uniref:quinone oxidoreductase family protein n=1 Tax=Chryseobacterium gossypii TaxID=3231602 RepID=UPI003525E91C